MIDTEYITWKLDNPFMSWEWFVIEWNVGKKR